jgi:hypothetical protein
MRSTVDTARTAAAHTILRGAAGTALFLANVGATSGDQ